LLSILLALALLLPETRAAQPVSGRKAMVVAQEPLAADGPSGLAPLLTPCGRPKSLTAPSAPIYGMTSRIKITAPQKNQLTPSIALMQFRP
jgi:hypothetical protein